MKEVIGASGSSMNGHVYTVTEVQIRLARLEKDLRDLSGLRASILGNTGFSGRSGYYGNSGFSGSSGSYDLPGSSSHYAGRSGTCEERPHVAYERSRDDFSDEGFFAKGIRELKEYFQALFVKIVNKKEIEHGK